MLSISTKFCPDGCEESYLYRSGYSSKSAVLNHKSPSTNAVPSVCVVGSVAEIITPFGSVAERSKPLASEETF